MYWSKMNVQTILLHLRCSWFFLFLMYDLRKQLKRYKVHSVSPKFLLLINVECLDAKNVCIVSFWVGVSEVASRVPRPARLRWQMVEDYRPRSRGAVMNRSPQPVHHCAWLRANTCLNREMCLSLNIAIIERQCFAEASWWSSWSRSESKEGEILSCLQSPQVCDPPQACPACPL